MNAATHAPPGNIQLERDTAHTRFAEIVANGKFPCVRPDGFLICGAHEKGGGSANDFAPDA
ncbi:hypothetical protein Sliba_31320 [Streptomyces nigrescens]|uniref:Uncharacterized protein n=1 Tax=Streptomyces nigrescens TaxID=1920 RepID=A0A640TGG8_STRNI|nr:hypothetical protein Sliba_31320 [Streptomyces libani subsp. libani]GGV91526.1 hypothetical protein GCM10010500_22120 [Streptomyces libani subsp. libani]